MLTQHDFNIRQATQTQSDEARTIDLKNGGKPFAIGSAE
jgi:hypothetical protein